MRCRQQQGFTLIELMVVITIIGILAVFGLPLYQNYTAKAQATEGLQATSGIRTEIALFYALNNRWPQQGDVSGVSTLAGKYFQAGGIAINGGDTDTVAQPTTESTIKISYGSGANQGHSMVLRPIAGAPGQIASWRCESPQVMGIGSDRLPSSCQH